MEPDYLLDGLSQAQLQAVTASTKAPIVVQAAAGSGKTRVLTRRVAWWMAKGELNPDRVLALTFTRRAAEELRIRQLQLGQRDRILAGTFHSVALNQLRLRWAEQNRTPPKILDNKVRLIQHVCKHLDVSFAADRQARKATVRRLTPSDIAAEVDWAQARLITPADYPEAATLAGRQPPIESDRMAEVLAAYNQEKRRRRVIDFDDLLVTALTSMRQDPAYAAAVRWRFSHIYVDEFQDINPLQFELLQEWRKGNGDVFVVGDPNQAIYGWNGADPQLLNRFTEHEPHVTVIHLTENFRSTPHVLKLARTVLTKPESAPTTQRTDGPIPTVQRLADDAAEASHIAETVRDLHSFGDAWAEQAILTRTNAQLHVIADALKAAGIPARHRVGDGPLRQPFIRTELQAITMPGSDLNAWLEQTAALLAEPRDGLPFEQRSQRSHLEGLRRLVDEYVHADSDPTGPGLSSWVGVIKPDDVTSDEDSVDLLTFHSCKGLEWPIVHIAGLENGLVPIAYAETGEQRNEEKRLLYVALTRAKENLHLTWAAKRDFGGRPSRRKPSPYVDPIINAIAQCEASERQRPDWKRRLTESRSVLTGDSANNVALDSESFTVDNAVEDPAARRHAALLRWRQRKARSADVEPSAILTDDTLEAIVHSLEPATEDGAGAEGGLVNDTNLLATVPGLSAAAAHRYGSELVKVVNDAAQAAPCES